MIPNNTGVWWFVGTVLISFAAILAIAYFLDDLLEWLKRTEYKFVENYRRKQTDRRERKEREEEERRRKKAEEEKRRKDKADEEKRRQKKKEEEREKERKKSPEDIV